MHRRVVHWLRLLAAVAAGFLVAPSVRSAQGAPADNAHKAYLPQVTKPSARPAGCQPLPGAHYASLTISGEPGPVPAAAHPDLNPALRGYTVATGCSVGLIDNCSTPPDDPGAPQLRGLFADHRRPTFLSVHWVYQWDDVHDRPASAVENRWGPSFVKVATTPSEIVSVPAAGRLIDNSLKLQVLVLYVGADWITLKYTREDTVVGGYTLHLQGLCVDPALQALYDSLEAAGRGQLPALQAGQVIGRAKGAALGISIRDCGSWMDPRNCNDWWRQ